MGLGVSTCKFQTRASKKILIPVKHNEEVGRGAILVTVPMRSSYRKVTVEEAAKRIVSEHQVGHFIIFSGSLVLMATPLIVFTVNPALLPFFI